MPTVTVAQAVRVGGSPVAHMVTRTGTAVSLGYTPAGVQITPAAPVYTQVERQGLAPLILAEKRRPAKLSFSHQLVNPRGGSIDPQIHALTHLVENSAVVRLIGVSGREAEGWWLIDDMQVTVTRRTIAQQALRADVSWTLLPYESGSSASGGKTAGQPPKVPALPKAATAGSRTHTVVSGDTLWAIAARYLESGAKYPAIASLNGIKNPNLIFPGTVLKIPAG